MFVFCSILFFAGLLYVNVTPDSSSLLLKSSSSSSIVGSGSTSNIPTPYNTPSLALKCQDQIALGSWNIHNNCQPGMNINPALCISSEWIWNPENSVCKFHNLKTNEASNLYKNRRIVFIGDSATRSIYHRFNKLIDTSGKYSEITSGKHENFQQYYSQTNTTVEFHWSPFILNMTNDFFSTSTPFVTKSDDSIYILGSTIWDSLHIHDLTAYQKDLKSLQPYLESRLKKNLFWVLPLKIIDSRLNTEEKRTFMTEEKVQLYRQKFLSSPISSFITIINPINITLQREDTTTDGVHYTPEIYDVIVQLISNSFQLSHSNNNGNNGNNGNNNNQNKKPVTNPYPNGKPTGSMSNSTYGAIVLLFGAIMIFTWDSFLGAGYISLKLVGKSYDWNDAYVPLLKKIFPHHYTREEQRDPEESKPMIEIK
mmetsp:Transcript_9066/g.9592  ORF Transcript_9066/g.9592 Transcript_9066/m.9592 type:complete len:425 (+) Transcript_9066:28-1302(+)